jgi:PAS domain S-box-containing protein
MSGTDGFPTAWTDVLVDVLVRMSANGAITWVSASVSTSLGWRPDDLVGTRWGDLVDPDDLGIVDAAKATVVAGGRGSGRLRVRRPDGSYRWVSAKWARVRDEEGAFVGCVAGLWDAESAVATERKAAEAVEHYRMVAEGISDFTVLVRPGGQVVWVAPNITTALGWTPEDLVGTRVDTKIHPEDQVVLAALRTALYSGAPSAVEGGGFVMRVRTKAGKYLWMSARATIVPGEAGVVPGVVVGLRDVEQLVEEREVAVADREAVRSDLASVRAIYDSLMDPHIMLRAVRGDDGSIVDFVYLDANPAAREYNGLSADELIGKRLLSLFGGHAGTELFDAYRQVVETGVPMVVDDVPYVHEVIGEQRYYDIRAARIGDGMSVTWRDSTVRHVAQERRNRFLSQISSELKSPLEVAQQYVELLADQVGGPLANEQEALLGVVSRAVDKLRAMADDLVEASRVGGGRLVVDCRPMALGPVLDGVVDTWRVRSEAEGVTIGLNVGDLPLVLADRDRVGEVLDNLLDNALTHTPSGGRIDVTVVEDAGSVIVSVADTGCGIPSEHLARLFEDFFQVARSGGASSQSLGLGLLISRDLVERQGGSVRASSTLGTGTTIAFTIPVASEAVADEGFENPAS